MAYNRRFNASFPDENGTTWRIDFEKDGTVTDETIDLGRPAFSVSWGSPSAGLFAPIKGSTCEVTFQSDNTTDLDDLRAVRNAGTKEYRVRIFKGGSEWWRGYALPGFLDTRMDDRQQGVKIRAKERLSSLESVDFADSSGNAFSGRAGLIDIIADCAGKLNFGYGFKGVVSWHSYNMSSSDDPLKITIDRDRYYSEDDEGNTIFPSCHKVLTDVLGRLNLQLMQHSGNWWVINPQHIKQDGTKSLTFTDYDSSGTDQGTTTSKSVVLGASTADWLEGGREEGREPYKDATVIYDSGNLIADVINGGFEIRGANNLAKNWSIGGGGASDFAAFDGTLVDYTNGVQSRQGPVAGKFSQGITSVERSSSRSVTDWDDGTVSADITKWMHQDITQVTSGTTDITIGFEVGAYTEIKQDASGTLVGPTSAESNPIKGWYAVKIGTQWWDPGSETWGTSRVWIPFKRGNEKISLLASGRGVHEQTATVGSAPETGQLRLELSQGIARDQLGSDYSAYLLYDNARLVKTDANDNRVKSRKDRAYVTDIDDGQAFRRQLLVGDGPFDTAPGALETPAGNATKGWQVGPYSGGASSGVALGVFHAKETLRALRTGRDAIRTTWTRGLTGFAPYAAVNDGSKWFYPVQIRQEYPSARTQMTGVELRYDANPANTEQEESTAPNLLTGGNTAAVHTDVTGRLGQMLTSQALTKTTAALSEDTAVTSISVQALSDVIFKDDTLQLINEATATVYDLTMNAEAVRGDTTLTVESFTPDERVVEDSYIFRGGSNLNTRISQTRRAVQILAQSNRVAVLDEEINGRTRTSIAVREVSVQKEKGTHLMIMHSGGDQVAEIVLDADLSPGDSSATIQEQRIDALKGDDIVMSGPAVEASINVQPRRIDLMVQKDRDTESVAQLTSAVSGATTSLPVTGLNDDLESGDSLQVRTRTDDIYDVTVSSDTASGSSSIPINSTTVNAEKDDHVMAGDGSDRSRLSVELKSITADTDVLKDDDWDGTVDSSGNITSFATTESWALSGAGDVEFRDNSGNFYRKNSSTHKLASAGKSEYDLVNETLTFGDASDPGTGTGVFMGKDGTDYELRVGDPAGKRMHWDGSNLLLNEARVQGLENSSDLTLMGWQFDSTFSASDNDTVAWTAGTLTMGNGLSFSINANNTGNITATTYIYFDRDASSTELQTTTTAATAIGADKILIARATNVADATKDCEFFVFGGHGGVSKQVVNNEIAATAVDTPEINTDAINNDKIAADAVTAGEIAANTITAGEIAADTITASQVAANTLTASEIAADTITASEIAANTITASQIAGNTITATEVATDTLTANEIAANTITAGEIAAGGVDTDELAANSVTAGKITVTDLEAVNTNTGSLTVTNTLTMGTSGQIKVGTGTKDTDFTGFIIDDSEIVGQNSGADQVAISGTDGKLTAGGGIVELNANGLQITAETGANTADENKIQFLDGNGNEDGAIWQYENGKIWIDDNTSSGIVLDSGGIVNIQTDAKTRLNGPAGTGFEVKGYVDDAGSVAGSYMDYRARDSHPVAPAAGWLRIYAINESGGIRFYKKEPDGTTAFL